MGEVPRFSPDGCDIWCVFGHGRAIARRVGGEWKEHPKWISDIENPPEGYPWGSSQYRVTDDWWVLGPDGKRLLLLSPPWQSADAVHRVWKGQFLALLHGGLLEPVILNLEGNYDL